MSVESTSTSEAEPTPTTGARKRPGRGFMAGGVWMPALGKNEFASTGREWAIKPPPGTESDPLTWETIRRDLEP